MTIVVKDDTLKLLQKEIREIMDSTANKMIEGVCEDFANYRHHVGIIYGLALAERELLAIDDMLHRTDETDH